MYGSKGMYPEWWMQIIRGPRVPFAKWQPQFGKRNPSAVSKIGNDVKSPLEKPTVPRKESVPPDVAAVAARKRVLGVFWVTFGEDDDIFLVIREAFTKARAQAQLRAVSGRIQVCKSFSERERNGSRLPIVKARESLAEALRLRRSKKHCCGWRAEVESASSHRVEPTISDYESMALVPAPQSAVLLSELIKGPREAPSGWRREWDRCCCHDSCCTQTSAGWPDSRSRLIERFIDFAEGCCGAVASGQTKL